MTVEETCTAYNDGTLVEPELDVFFDHDRAVRENGHDTSNRVEDLCADLATVDLNCLLYRIEEDIAIATQTHFDDSLTIPAEFCAPGDQPNTIESSNIWFERAQKRKDLINKYCWNEEKGMYLDYNTVTKQQSTFEGVTCLWPLWCGIASDKQAARLVKDAIPTFERVGGLASTSEETRGTVSEVNPQKQWDYPNGWAPHQILAWDGLRRYGYFDESARLNYRWLHLLTECFRNWNGSVVEKYNVTDLKRPHKVDAEYGNQGRNFKYAPQEGYVAGTWTILRRSRWLIMALQIRVDGECLRTCAYTLSSDMCGYVVQRGTDVALPQNASYIYGLSLATSEAKEALAQGLPWEDFAQA